MSYLYKTNFYRQIIWIVLGFIAMFLVYKIRTIHLIKNSRIFYILSTIMLVLVLLIGKRVNGASSWFRIGILSFQPSEIVKFFYLISISKVAASSKPNFTAYLKVLFLSLIPIILIFLEPDTGVVVMYSIMILGIILGTKISKKPLYAIFLIFILFLTSFFLLYEFKQELFIKIFGTSFFYRMDRLLSFKNKTSYQLENALIGMGSSGLLGHGILKSKLYIPEATTDFVFSLTVLNFGLVGGILVILIYAFLLIKVYNIGLKQEKTFNKCVIFGIFSIFLFQVLEHIFMNIGYTPITGITLPFLSYGGSSLISYFMMFGLVLKGNK